MGAYSAGDVGMDAWQQLHGSELEQDFVRSPASPSQLRGSSSIAVSAVEMLPAQPGGCEFCSAGFQVDRQLLRARFSGNIARSLHEGDQERD